MNATQFICRAQPVCRCTGADSCDCAHNPETDLCTDCGEPTEEIDVATGEAVVRG